MKPIFQRGEGGPARRIVLSEARTERMLRPRRWWSTRGLAKLILIGRPAVIERRIERNGLRIKPGTDFDLVNPESDPRYREYWTNTTGWTERSGVTQQSAQVEMRSARP